MGLIENFQMAWASIRSNKMRSLLTMLGIIIGIAAVIAIETVGNSMSGYMTDSFSGLGTNNINVVLTHKTADSADGTADGVFLRQFMETRPGKDDLITDQMIREFQAAFPDKVDHVELSTMIGTGTIAKYGNPNVTIKANVQGTNGDYYSGLSRTTPLLAGRWLDDSRDEGRMVCVVSEKFVQQAMGCTLLEALGQRITLEINETLYSFYVEGVLKYSDTNFYGGFGGTSDDDITTDIYLPMDVAQTISGSSAGYSSFIVVASAGTDVTKFLDTVGSYFSSYYTHNDTWTVTTSSISSFIQEYKNMMSTVSLGISAIAAISLLVGGIGVMNIMLVSVTERTREIGTRKALGAPNSAIRMQFITESIVLCSIGGIIGMLLGTALGAVLSKVMQAPARPDPAAILIAVGFSMTIGIFFGYYPANKAAKMDPIEALRYE